MDQVSWWVPLVALVVGALLSEMRAFIDRRFRSSHEESLQSERFNYEKELLDYEYRVRRDEAQERQKREDELFKRESLLALDDSVSEFARTVVQIHLERPDGIDQHDRWWRVHVNHARDVRRLLARVDDETLLRLARATLDAGHKIIYAEESIEHIAAMGLTQDNASDVSNRIGELLRDPVAPQWQLKDSPAPGDGRYEPS